MNIRASLFLVGIFCLVSSAVAVRAQELAPPGLPPDLNGPATLLVTPAPDHAPFIDAIDHARSTIGMAMFHLTDPAIADALIRAAQRHVDIRVLVDGRSLETEAAMKDLANKMRHYGIAVHGSSPAFSITHEKAMVIDGHLAFITAINLTTRVAVTRDFGIVLADPAVIQEWLAVFAADWANADNGGNVTPPLHNPNLLWSPVNSEARLVALINGARRTIETTVENLGDAAISQAFIAAAHRGVQVRIIVPLCDRSPDPTRNVALERELMAGGVQAKVMPSPSTAQRPYMHSKMIIVDGASVYVGSVNFSENSTQHAREVGLAFTRTPIARQMQAYFEADWRAAIAPPPAFAAVAAQCGATGGPTKRFYWSE